MGGRLLANVFGLFPLCLVIVDILVERLRAQGDRGGHVSSGERIVGGRRLRRASVPGAGFQRHWCLGDNRRGDDGPRSSVLRRLQGPGTHGGEDAGVANGVAALSFSGRFGHMHPGRRPWLDRLELDRCRRLLDRLVWHRFGVGLCQAASECSGLQGYRSAGTKYPARAPGGARGPRAHPSDDVDRVFDERILPPGGLEFGFECAVFLY